MKEYVCGFLFHRGRVALVEKARPAWQAGRLNGVGGEVEAGETPRRAMAREFLEEAGLPTFESDWREAVVLTGGGRRVTFYRGSITGLAEIKWRADETVDWYDAVNLPPAVLPDLRWLIPLCLDGGVTPPVRVDDSGPPADGPPLTYLEFKE